MVEPSAFRASARRARLAFFVAVGASAVLGAMGFSPRWHPLVGAVLGGLLGMVLGAVAAAAVLVWPVFRMVWHWSAEIALAVAVLLAVKALAAATHPAVTVAVLLAAFGVPAAVPPVRRRAAAVVWCAVVRHRLRLCFAEFIRSANRVRPGSSPLILLARPTPAGERVWVWLRPGLDLSDLDGKTDKLAVACWAGEARVVRASTRYAALIRVDISRRDPLIGLVTSPLVR